VVEIGFPSKIDAAMAAIEGGLPSKGWRMAITSTRDGWYRLRLSPPGAELRLEEGEVLVWELTSPGEELRVLEWTSPQDLVETLRLAGIHDPALEARAAQSPWEVLWDLHHEPGLKDYAARFFPRGLELLRRRAEREYIACEMYRQGFLLSRKELLELRRKVRGRA